MYERWSIEQLLTLFLRKEQAMRVKSSAYGLKSFLRGDVAELKTLGLSQREIDRVCGAMELFRRAVQEEINGAVLNSWVLALEYFQFLRGLQEEYLYVVSLNSKLRVIACDEVFRGSLYQSVAHQREVCALAIQRRAANMIIAHNHPSGAEQPTEEDIQFTQKMYETSLVIGIKLIDHIVVGNPKMYSFKKEGFFDGDV